MEKNNKFTIRRENLRWIKDSLFNGRTVDLAKRIDKDPSYVGRLLYPEGKPGAKNIAEGVRLDIERALSLPSGWLDTPNAGSDVDLLLGLSEHQSARLNLTHDSDLNYPKTSSDSYSIPKLSLAASMGSGEYFTYGNQEVVDFLPTTRLWVKSTLNCKPEDLRVITGAGDSMSPTFNDGDLLIVDTSKTTVNIDGVYAMSAHGRLFIKRVRQKITGEFEISSDNPTVKTVDILNGSSEVTVHGRVVWAWNGSKL